MQHRKLILAEINEITWDLIDPWIAQGKLPNFALLKKNGLSGAPMSVDLPPQLDPWITWTTVYTGQRQAEHNVFFLQQPPESIQAKRIWEVLSERGVKVGVYGSLCSWPPQPVDGFYVPDTFSPDSSTYPPDLESIQRLNLTYTRTVRLPSDQDTLGFKLKLGMKLVQLGLSPGTIAAIVRQLLTERADGSKRWQRVVLQPRVNFDFFSRLYRQHRPDFATFHTNHVAHYMHTYWQAMQPERFRPLETSSQEVATHGGAIEYGYQAADELLGNMLRLMDSETVLVVASSMGQKPYLSALDGGKAIAQVRSHKHLLKLLGVEDRARIVSTMSDEFNVYVESERLREQVRLALKTAYLDKPEQPLFVLGGIDSAIRVNLKTYEVKKVKETSRIVFPEVAGSPSCSYSELIYNTGHLKSGCHDPRGVLMIYGAGIPAGAIAESYDNLDIAPTLYHLMGQPPPNGLTGRVIQELAGETVGVS